jgi:NTP pyrophosphatase (non-canonical NTP hydrolase)
MNDSIADLQSEVVRFRDERDWARFHTPKDLLLGLTIEAGELAELLLWKSEAEIDRMLADPASAERVRDEVADVQVFLLYLAHRLRVPLADAVRRKMRKNAEKYPVERSRGSARKYTELGDA